jgi:hypothetical protein
LGRSNRYIAEFGIEEEKSSEFVPIVKTQCICPPPEMIDGVLYEIHDPSCLADGHGCQGHYIPQAEVRWKDTRTIGKLHSGHKSSEK